MTDLTAVRGLMVEAEGIEAAYGPNPYSDYLRAHKKRPPVAEAAAMGKLWGGRVRADDGKMYPALTKKFRKERKQRQEDFRRTLEAAPHRPWLHVSNDH